MSHSPPLFLYLCLFFLNVQLVDKILPMLGFEPQISGVGSNCSTNWATTIAHLRILLGEAFDQKCNLLEWKCPLLFWHLERTVCILLTLWHKSNLLQSAVGNLFRLAPCLATNRTNNIKILKLLPIQRRDSYSKKIKLITNYRVSNPESFWLWFEVFFCILSKFWKKSFVWRSTGV